MPVLFVIINHVFSPAPATLKAVDIWKLSMQIIRTETLADLQAYEKAISSNARLHRYGLDKFCPTSEFLIFRCECDHTNLASIYCLGEFEKHTNGNTGLVRDINPLCLSDKSKSTLAHYASISLDARCDELLSPILVAPDVNRGPFIAIDGNHKLIHHMISFGSIQGLCPFVCVHPRVLEWPFIPHHARKSKNG